MDDVIVKESKIHGKGVYATRDFKKGEVVIKWDLSKTLTEEEAKQVPEEEKKYVTFTNGKYVLEQPPARYVNHSCNHNTSTKIKEFCDVAIRDIEEGEEITSDYSEQMHPEMQFECKCGEENCRRTIKAD